MHMNMPQFSVPGLAAEAVNIRQLESSARKAGVTVVQLSYDFVYRQANDGKSYRCRVTCSVQMGVFLIEQLRLRESRAAERGQDDVAAACARGMRETYVALMAPPLPTRRHAAHGANAAQDGAKRISVGRTSP
jgi:hypothetical protein